METIQCRNSVEIVGRVGNAREIRLQSDRVVQMSVATSRIHKDRDGNITETVTWHLVKGWGSVCGKTDVKKGDAVRVRGRLEVQKYVNAEGADQTFTYILADCIEVLRGADCRSEE